MGWSVKKILNVGGWGVAAVGLLGVGWDFGPVCGGGRILPRFGGVSYGIIWGRPWVKLLWAGDLLPQKIVD